MYELKQVGEKTYYIDCPVKMGIYLMENNQVCLIDSGNDQEAGKKIQRILEGQGWSLGMIVNTHSHADHIGGNALLQKRLGCPVYCVAPEMPFISNPIMEPIALYGGYPCRELRHKFLMAQPSKVEELTPEVLPAGMEMLLLDGHTLGMVGLKTPDDVWFLGDCVTSEAILEKYHVSFLHNVEQFLETLDKVEKLEGKLFVPAHTQAVTNMAPLVEVNRANVREIVDRLLELCKTPLCFDDVLKGIFDGYGLAMNFAQHELVGSTIRSYLSYLYDKDRITAEFVENRLLWKTVD